MHDSPIHQSMRHLLLTQHLEEARREGAEERLARAARLPRRWRVLLSGLLVRLGGLLVAAGEALLGEPATAPADR